MKCPICKHGNTRPGTGSVTLDRGGITVVFQDVPAEVCDHCGEQFIDSATSSKLLTEADRAARSGVKVEVRSYKAA
ncbi:MAG: type II toxin-antitoxin system MqsA family antitoxin [Phycisphaerales bacterium]